MLGMVMYTYNPSTWAADAGRRLWVQGQLVYIGSARPAKGIR